MDNNTPVVKAIVKINILILEKPLGNTAMSVKKKVHKEMNDFIFISRFQSCAVSKAWGHRLHRKGKPKYRIVLI